MCKFFSLTSDGKGNILYFDKTVRKQIISGELSYETDSHTSINDYFGFKGALEDTRNKYEYNPLTKVFTIDQINTTDDSEIVKRKVKKLDFKLIVPELIIKPIINPLTDIKAKKVMQKNIEDLKKWDSVCDSVRDNVCDSVCDSVRGSVRDSVWDSVRGSVRDSVWDSVRGSVWDSVRGSVRDSVRDSVRGSVWDSVWDSVWGYSSSFFDIKYKYDFSPCVRLWEAGFVPVFYQGTWKFLSGPKAKIVYKLKK